MNDTIATIETPIDPEMIMLLTTIDHALNECKHRSLVSSDEVTNLLLDIRLAALALHR